MRTTVTPSSAYWIFPSASSLWRHLKKGGENQNLKSAGASQGRKRSTIAKGWELDREVRNVGGRKECLEKNKEKGTWPRIVRIPRVEGMLIFLHEVRPVAEG